ncbi:MAG: polysaccharide deacetylase [Clostridia bacterium]|nr:polysaccharide deacetylase [Clostridia bacterium]
MKGAPEYFTEVKTNKKSNIGTIIFCIVIGIISIGIVFATVILSYNRINKNMDSAQEGVTKTTGKTSYDSNGNNKSSKKDEKKEENPVAQKEAFPKHDFQKALDSELPQYNEEAERRLVESYSSDEKQIFLTFDDGPTTNITPKILDILKENDVKATFFVLGSRVDLYPEITKRAYDEGHFIANHSYSHVYHDIYSSPQAVLDEFNQCNNSVKSAIGVPNYNSHLFRFPGGSSGGAYAPVKNEAKGLLMSNGITYTNWNCLTGDAEGKNTADEQWNYLMETAGDKTSLIILMHDASDKEVTVELLPRIIKHYKDQGYVFRSYYDIMK